MRQYLRNAAGACCLLLVVYGEQRCGTWGKLILRGIVDVVSVACLAVV